MKIKYRIIKNGKTVYISREASEKKKKELEEEAKEIAKLCKGEYEFDYLEDSIFATKCFRFSYDDEKNKLKIEELKLISHNDWSVEYKRNTKKINTLYKTETGYELFLLKNKPNDFIQEVIWLQKAKKDEYKYTIENCKNKIKICDNKIEYLKSQQESLKEVK